MSIPPPPQFTAGEVPSFDPGFNCPAHPALSKLVDVCIVGSGPIGATYAKLCVEAGLTVVMLEIGAAESFTTVKSKSGGRKGPSEQEIYVPGYHKRNTIEFQKDLDRFVGVAAAELSTLSIPTANPAVATLDPSAFSNSTKKPWVSLGKNPNQDPFTNLEASAVTRGVGGMSTHWGCAVPRFDPVLERPKLSRSDDTNEWKDLYERAEKMIGMVPEAFSRSIRHNLVIETLKKAFKGDKNRVITPIPLAVNTFPNDEYIEWHSSSTLLESIYADPEMKKRFTLYSNHRCTRLVALRHSEHEHGTGVHPGGDPNVGLSFGDTHDPVAQVVGAQVRDLLGEKNNRYRDTYIMAKTFVVAAGAVCTPQILYNSVYVNLPSGPGGGGRPQRFHIPNLSRYLTEQPMSFCQIVLSADAVNSIPSDPFHKGQWWTDKVKKHQTKYPNDPIPIPYRDLEPGVLQLISKERPWHTEISRGAFAFGAVAGTIDTRLIVDFRSFSTATPNRENRVTFEDTITDAYGMPQPTFHFELAHKDKQDAHGMILDMAEQAGKIGGFLPGSEPQFMPPGTSLHIGGTIRMGFTPEDSVADTSSRVWGFHNLFVGGNGVIPTAFAANPTLTSMALAIKSANALIKTVKPETHPGTMG